MNIRILGAAAGGGFPQWNCNCPNCAGLRRGTVRAKARTQSSIAISCDARSWVLINASPDILAQIRGWPDANPVRSIRDTAIAAIVLVDSQIDHASGLLMLREGGPLELYTTHAVREDLSAHLTLLKVLDSYCGVRWHQVPSPGCFEITQARGLSFRAIPIAGKAPPYSPGRTAPRAGDNIGLAVQDTRSGRRLVYAPGIESIDDDLRRSLGSADCVLIDGTFWTDDELILLGAGSKRAQEMGHLALSGSGGMLSELERFDQPRKILVHINNTNPILDEDSPERRELDQMGIEVGYDGMEIEL
jgi:pyrroloquinoline quinone biosynthesis protein B